MEGIGHGSWVSKWVYFLRWGLFQKSYMSLRKALTTWSWDLLRQHPPSRGWLWLCWHELHSTVTLHQTNTNTSLATQGGSLAHAGGMRHPAAQGQTVLAVPRASVMVAVCRCDAVTVFQRRCCCQTVTGREEGGQPGWELYWTCGGNEAMSWCHRHVGKRGLRGKCWLRHEQ